METLVILIGILVILATGITVGIYQSKKRAKTALPGKKTEIDSDSDT